jgi:tetratricopeptide (TPR) repeat protein
MTQPISSRLRRRAAFVTALPQLILGIAVLGATPAAAEEAAIASEAADLKRARDQFEQALAMQTAGDWAGALALLKEVAAVKATPQVRFNMALCEERLGRLVSALGGYELAAADARAEGAEQVAQEVEARLESLRERIPKIIVRRGSGAEAAWISLDGVALGDQVVGTPMLADPGPHTVEAKAPGYKPFRRSVRVDERQTETVHIVLEPEPQPSAAIDTPPRVSPRTRGNGATYGYVIGGLGLASLGASAAFFGLRSSKISELDEACGSERRCPPELADDIDRGRLYTTLGNVTLAVGAAAVAGGLVLVLANSGSGEPSVALAPAPLGAQVLGRF